MQKSPILILLLTFNLIFGQEKLDPTESLIGDFKSQMKNENISNFFIVKHITYGGFRIPNPDDPDQCFPKTTYFSLYGFWNDGTETYVKKYDNCGGFTPLKLDSSRPIDFYKENLNKIKLEEVGEYKIKPDSIVNGTKHSFIASKSHTPQRYFWFQNDSFEFKKRFDKYDLESEEGNKNLNYEYNNNLAIVKLNVICEEIINELVKKKMFSRIK